MALNIEKVWDQVILDLKRENHAAYQVDAEFLAEQGGHAFGVLLRKIQEEEHPRVALDIINKMSEAHRRQFVSSLVGFGLSHSRTGFCWDTIASLNGNWLKQNIETLVRPVLTEDDDDAWQQILGLLWRVDKTVYTKIAREAAQSSNPHIVEAGIDALEND